MAERTGAITFKGNPMTLAGNEVKVGDKAPDCRLVAQDMSEKTLGDFKGKVLIISVVPSLDTPTCDKQTRRFSQEAAEIGDDVAILTISRDLPFAQKRWCGAAGVQNLTTLSDYKDGNFGRNFGLIIQELGLLARAVLIIDKEGTIQYFQLVKEVSQEPDYDQVLEELRAVA